MAPTSPGNCSSSLRMARAAFLSQALSGTSSSLAAEPGERTGAAGLMCWAPDGLNCARCSLRNRCTNNLSWADETSGSQACVGASLRPLHAIDATGFPLTRRDGPDAVRNGSNSKKRPPTTSSDGHESRQWLGNGRRVRTVVKKFSSATIVYFPYGAY